MLQRREPHARCFNAGNPRNALAPLHLNLLTLSGKDGNDAKAYQEKDVNNALQKLEEIKKAQEEEQE
ncbi:MAG: hypothetical protein KME31_37185 [Tolypothrix carrinoi HA7290-LM1]|nr:hypothetical protein [Tolypothrix carrinoi HA7290-LM1]